MKILKTYENYEKTGDSVPKISEQEINERIKEIIENINKATHYFSLLKDTADYVYDMLSKQIPQNAEAFLSSVQDRDEVLTNLLEDLIGCLDESSALNEIDEISSTLNNIKSYTEDSIDQILAGKFKNEEEQDYEDDDYEEEDEEEDEDEENMCPRCRGAGINDDGSDCESCDGTGFKPENKPGKSKDMRIEGGEDDNDGEEYIEIMKPPKRGGERDDDSHDQVLEAKSVVSKGKLKEMEDLIRRHAKSKGESFIKGEIIWLNGIYGSVAKKYNGKKCTVIGKNQDREGDCYDLHDPTSPGEGANIIGMPSQYIFREKPKEIVNEPPKKVVKKKK